MGRQSTRWQFGIYDLMMLTAVVCMYLSAITWTYRSTEGVRDHSWRFVAPGIAGAIGALLGRQIQGKRAFAKAGRPLVRLWIVPPWGEVFLCAGALSAIGFALSGGPDTLLLAYDAASTMALVQAVLYALRGQAVLTIHGIVLDKLGGIGFVPWSRTNVAVFDSRRDPLLRIKTRWFPIFMHVPANERKIVEEIMATAHSIRDHGRIEEGR